MMSGTSNADESLSRLEDGAESLAGEGRWADLGALLESIPRELLLSEGSLAYRYGEALYHTGRMEDLAAHAEVLEAASRQRVDVDATMRALNLAGIAAFELGRVGRALVKFDSLMELAESEDSVDMLARAANNLGAIANLRGRRHEALAYYHLAAPLYQKLGQVRGLAQTHHNIGLTYRDLDKPDDAIAAFEHAISLSRDLSYDFLRALSMAGKAEIELRLADGRLSERLADRALQLARDIGDPISEAEALRVRGLARASDAAATAGDSGWKADLEAALTLARETRNALLEAEIERDLGWALSERGDEETGHRLLESAAVRFQGLGALAETRRIRERLSTTS